MIKTARLLFLTGFLAVLFPAISYACKCPEPTREIATASYEQTGIVVLAEPVFFSKGWGGGQPLVKLKIIHIYKGSVGNEVTAQYNNVIAACGLSLEQGKQYILGLADLYSASTASRRAGGFRLLSSCQQHNLYTYLTEPEINEHPQTKQESQ